MNMSEQDKDTLIIILLLISLLMALVFKVEVRLFTMLSFVFAGMYFGRSL